MGLYGPLTAVVNTLQQCNIDGAAQGVYIVNTSRYDLAIAFQSSQPTNVTNFGGAPWYNVVPAGDRQAIQIPLGVYGAAGFPGYIWVLPIDGTTSYATTGATSNNVQFYLESFADVTLMPGDYASAQFSNAASQQRVIALPFSTGGANSSTSVTTPNATTTAVISPNYSLAGFEGGQFVFFVYYVYISSLNDAAGAGHVTFNLGVDLRDSTNASIGGPYPQSFFFGVGSWTAGAGPMTWPQFNPLWPAEVVASVPTGGLPPYHLNVVIITGSETNKPSALAITLAAGIGALVTQGNFVSGLGPLGAPNSSGTLY